MQPDLLLRLGVVLFAVVIAFGMSALVGLVLGLGRPHLAAFGPSRAERPPRIDAVPVAGANPIRDREDSAGPDVRGLVRRVDRPGGRGAP